MIKFHAFIIYLAIPYMGVRVSGLKLVISPTKLELLKSMKICAMLNPSFQGTAGDIYYVYLIKPEA
jgi:hypothetical protein